MIEILEVGSFTRNKFLVEGDCPKIALGSFMRSMNERGFKIQNPKRGLFIASRRNGCRVLARVGDTSVAKPASKPAPRGLKRK